MNQPNRPDDRRYDDPYDLRPIPVFYRPHQPAAPPPPAIIESSATVWPQQVAVVASPPTSGWAVAALIFGILGILGGFCFFGIPCIVAVICGHAGLRETNSGVKGGRGMATAGCILGYIFVAPAIVLTLSSLALLGTH